MSTQRLAGRIVPVTETDHQTPHGSEIPPEQAAARDLKGSGHAEDPALSGAVMALIQETDHRVKNTIQSIASLLMLQARSCGAPRTRMAASRWFGKLQWMLIQPSRTR